MEADYIPNFINSEKGVKFFDELWNNLEWVRHSDAPRREYWTNIYDRDYTYGRGSGIRTYKAMPAPAVVLDASEDLFRDPRVGTFFEGCFINGYESNRDWLGWHSDDDAGIDHNRPIAILTLYDKPDLKPRIIQFRNNDNPSHVTDLPLYHGSLCLMPARSQFTTQHRIPKAGFECGRRISLTFRGLV